MPKPISLPIYCVSIVLFFSAGCKAQPNSWVAAPSNHSLLWEVTGNGLPEATYLLGTMHILCPQDAQLSPQAAAIIQTANEIYFELDLSDMTQIFNAMKAMAMKDGQTLKDLLTPVQYQKVVDYFEKNSPLPFKLLERYKPLLLSGMVAESSLPCEATNGMELLIMEEANKWKKKIKGLETMEFQAGLFDSIPYAVQAQALMKAIDSLGKSTSEVDSLMHAYRRQDLDAIERLTMLEEDGMNGQTELLLYRRNSNWAAQFDTLASKGTLLIAVGAGHLPGEKGLLQLLRNKGYILRPLLNEIQPATMQTSR